MEPVASHWQEHHALGDSLIAGLQGAGGKIFSNGKMEKDLTQTQSGFRPSSPSSIPLPPEVLSAWAGAELPFPFSWAWGFSVVRNLDAA